MAPRSDITGLLRAWSHGDASALERLTPLVYGELLRIARRNRRRGTGETLETAALVHEAYLRLAGSGGLPMQDRGHFFAVAAQMMRRIVVDSARSRAAGKRGGDAVRIPLDTVLPAPSRDETSLLALDQALDALGRRDPRKAKVVELRFFGGLSIAETAEVLGISVESVMRDWRLAKPWLAREVEGGSDGT